MGKSLPMLTVFAAGLASFFSPCVLPLIPAYISYIAGFSLEELKDQDSGRVWPKVLGSTLLFVLGFTVAFTAMGATASSLGTLLSQYRTVIEKIAGTVIVLFGLQVMGLFQIKYLQLEKRVTFKKRPWGLAGAFVIGLAFAVGWTPCIGPILASVLLYASTAESVWQGMGLLTIYSLGLGIPFILVGLGISRFLAFFDWFKKRMRAVEIIAGFILILLGVLVLTGNFATLTGFLYRLGD